MNAFLTVLSEHNINHKECLRRKELAILQVNMGNLCNQSCRHCHIGAHPSGDKIMSKKVVDDILGLLARFKIPTLDITGGAPELNPHFEYLVKKARILVDEIIVRTNLTVIFEKGKENLVKFYKDNRVRLICSLPSSARRDVDWQRGEGVFEKSIHALRLLNECGFGTKDELELDLVYNPVDDCISPSQTLLDKEYRYRLSSVYGVEFNRLLTITNVPIKRYKEHLKSQGKYESYFELLKDNFNPQTLDNLMCRSLVSVGYDGKLYDCDFNLALGLYLKDEDKKPLTIDKLSLDDLRVREITIGSHCLSCTASSGSSCQGALADSPAIAGKRETVKEYYSRVLKTKDDLKTSACCSSETIPLWQRKILAKIAPEILEKFYGCGSPIPPLLEGKRVLDLGCGTGRDVYVCSYLCGEDGEAIGVDMTDEQLAVAKKHIDEQMKIFKFSKPNVKFIKGYIEDLKPLGIEDNSIDVVISNCVINLSFDKEAVFGEIFRVLKEGGELYFSDVFADRRIPAYLKDDPVLYGECLGGAMYIEDFRRLLLKLGINDFRIVSKRQIKLHNQQLEEKVGGINFYSMTIRAFKLYDLEDRCEDYGQVAVYQGTIPYNRHSFSLDGHHLFIAKKPMLVCGNTASMLSHTRYREHFLVQGKRDVHYGIFDCAPAGDKKEEDFQEGSCC